MTATASAGLSAARSAPEAARATDPLATGGPSYTIQGRTITLPVHVRDAVAVSATFVVPAAAARALLPTPALQLVEIYPGGALCALAAIEYRDNDLGQYNEVAVNLFVQHRRGRALPLIGAIAGFWRQDVGVYIHRLPVTTSFSRDAGRDIWGFPKTVDEIRFQDVGTERRCTLASDGQHVLTLSARRGGRRQLAEMPQDAYAWRDGRLFRTRSLMRGDGVGFRLGGARLELGTHPIADELRALGLPRSALMTMSMEHFAARFDAPQEV